MNVRVAANDRPLDLGDVVAERGDVDHLAGVLVALGIEGVDVAHAAAHEQEDDRLGPRQEMRQVQRRILNLPRLRPKRAHRRAEEPAAGQVKHAPTRDFSTRIER